MLAWGGELMHALLNALTTRGTIGRSGAELFHFGFALQSDDLLRSRRESRFRGDVRMGTFS
jgi:hypothetical protein